MVCFYLGGSAAVCFYALLPMVMVQQVVKQHVSIRMTWTLTPETNDGNL